MSLDEAKRIARTRLADEPADDWLTSWRRTMPAPEPKREERKLDTMQIDWPAEIRAAVARERAFMTEVIGQALAEYGDGIITEIEQKIAAAADRVRADLRAEFAQAIGLLRRQIDTQGSELRAELEKIIAKRRRAKAAATSNETFAPLQLPAPNGNGHAQ
jgi:hypothetical protein